MMRASLTSLALLLAACTGDPTKGDAAGTDEESDVGTPTDVTDVSDEPELPEVRSCHGAPAPAPHVTGFRHTLNEVLALTEPDHSADDLLFTEQGEVIFHAKFAYGALSKDLQDEDIEVWLDDCSGSYQAIGVATTDSDGRISLSLAPSALPGFGSYALIYRVLGDGSGTRATLRVLPTGTHVLVTDIDGTLTTSDTELFVDLFSELGSGSYVPQARASAVDAMWARADQGYPIVYLTGRPYNLTDITREWIDALSFPPGTVQLVADVSRILPTDGAVGTYKRDYLDTLQARGFELDMGYGNATTDIFGYLGAGIGGNTAYILGTHGGEQGTVALGEDYTAHLNTIAGQSPPSQPFRW